MEKGPINNTRHMIKFDYEKARCGSTAPVYNPLGVS